jgi:hypothetical protein
VLDWKPYWISICVNTGGGEVQLQKWRLGTEGCRAGPGKCVICLKANYHLNIAFLLVVLSTVSSTTISVFCENVNEMIGQDQIYFT